MKAFEKSLGLFNDFAASVTEECKALAASFEKISNSQAELARLISALEADNDVAAE